MRKYNHAFTIAFTVPGSKYKDPNECSERERNQIMQAIIKRAMDVFNNAEEGEALEHWDTTEEQG